MSPGTRRVGGCGHPHHTCPFDGVTPSRPARTREAGGIPSESGDALLSGSVGAHLQSAWPPSSTVIAQDSYDHASKSQGQWIREVTDVFTGGGFEDFGRGEYAGTRADSATGIVSLTRIEGTRWRRPTRR